MSIKEEEHSNTTKELYFYLTLENKLELLEGIADRKYGIKSTPVEEYWKGLGELHEDYFDFVVSNKKVPEKSFNYLISPLSEDDKNIWYQGFPFLIHAAYKNNEQSKLDKLLKIAKEKNKWAISHPREVEGRGSISRQVTEIRELEKKNPDKYLGKYGVVIIRHETMELALTRHDEKTFYRLLEISDVLREETQVTYRETYTSHGRDREIETEQKTKSKYSSINLYKPYEIKCKLIDSDPKMSEIDKHIQKAIHEDGILDVDELIFTEIKEEKTNGYSVTKRTKIRGDLVNKNLKKIYAALKENPIDYVELCLNLLNERNWDELKNHGAHLRGSSSSSFDKDYQKAIDEKDGKFIKKLLESRYDSRVSYGNKSIDINKWEPYILKRDENESLEHVYKRIKDNIIQDIELEEKMYNKIDGLDKSYFEKLFKKGNYRDLFIDLCVRLETVLEGAHGYEGDLAEMFTSYCGHDSSAKKISETIHKLIRCRNNMVHRNTTNETMTSSEIEDAIEYISNFK